MERNPQVENQNRVCSPAFNTAMLLNAGLYMLSGEMLGMSCSIINPLAGAVYGGIYGVVSELAKRFLPGDELLNYVVRSISGNLIAALVLHSVGYSLGIVAFATISISMVLTSLLLSAVFYAYLRCSETAPT